MGRTKAAKKRLNKKEFRARLKLEIEAREASIAELKMKLRQATAEMKIVKRYIITHSNSTDTILPTLIADYVTFGQCDGQKLYYKLLNVNSSVHYVDIYCAVLYKLLLRHSHYCG